MVRVFVGLGIEKIRLTGGEPLLRHGLVEMVQELSRYRTAYTPDGDPTFNGHPLDIALTTNGHLLESLAQPLKDAGLNRVTVSMDAVDPETFTAITRVPRSFHRVLSGVRKAKEVGLAPVKVNCVLLRGFNDHEIERFAQFSREENVIVRFIEFMPLEEDRSWKPETVVPMDELVARLNAFRPLVELPPHAASEDRTPLHLRRRTRRDWHHCPRLPPLLRTLQPRPPHLRRQDPHLSLLPVRPRPLRTHASRRNRCRPCCVCS